MVLFHGHLRKVRVILKIDRKTDFVGNWDEVRIDLLGRGV
jgi:hypothetical protein